MSDIDRWEAENIAEDKARQARYDAEHHADRLVSSFRADVATVVDELRTDLANVHQRLLLAEETIGLLEAQAGLNK
jgi:hypothetical protein